MIKQIKSQLNFVSDDFIRRRFISRRHRALREDERLPAGGAGSTNDWKLIWSDEFNGPAGAGVDANKWTVETGGGGNGNREWEFYTNDRTNAALDGHGCLDIVALKWPTNTFMARFSGATVHTVPPASTPGKSFP